MNFSILDNIKTIENGRSLNILFLNINDLQFSYNTYINLKNYGELFVVCKSNFQIGPLRGKLNGSRIKFILPHQIPPNINFDMVICESSILKDNKKLTDYFKFEYIYVLDENVTNELIEDYYVLSEHCLKFKFASIANDDSINENETNDTNLNVINDANNYSTSEDLVLTEGDYEILIKDFATEPIKYDKYRINYLYPQVPGKVSIIMTVSSLNNTFPDVLKDIRSQGIGLIEFIIIDNAAGFRNNVKPQIRYGQRMPIEFCEYHAKEFCSGEYMIFLTEESPAFLVSDWLERGLYEVR